LFPFIPLTWDFYFFIKNYSIDIHLICIWETRYRFPILSLKLFRSHVKALTSLSYFVIRSKVKLLQIEKHIRKFDNDITIMAMIILLANPNILFFFKSEHQRNIYLNGVAKAVNRIFVSFCFIIPCLLNIWNMLHWCTNHSWINFNIFWVFLCFLKIINNFQRFFIIL